MKRLVPFILALFCFFGATAQRTPEELKAVIDTEFSEIYDKYDFDVAFDSVLKLTDKYLREADKWTREFPSARNISNAAVWHSFRAHLLFNYLNIYYYRISRRTITENPDMEDPKTWDEATFKKEILADFYASLKEKTALTSVPAASYTLLFQMPEEEECYATLYDLLAYRFADCLGMNSLLSPDISLDNEYLFNDFHFIRETHDKDAALFESHPFILLMEEISRAHRPDADLSYQLYNRIVRFDFVYKNCRLENKDSLYLAALLRLDEESKHASHIVQQLTYNRIAKFYHSRGNKSAQYPDDFLTAIQWYEKAIAVAPDTKCGHICADNLAEIRKKKCVIALPHDPFYPEEQLMQIETKDCDKIFLAVAKIPKMDYDLPDDKPLDIVHREQVSIRNSHRFRPDTTFAILPELPTGNYTILIDTVPIVKGIPDEMYNVTEPFTVSRLTAFSVNVNENDVQVIVTDRKTGVPLSHVQVTISGMEKGKEFSETHQTDKNGITHFTSDKLKKTYHNEVTLKRGNDTLTYGYIHVWYPSWLKEKSYKGNLYTDRSIYRPGQPLQWKSIFLEGDNYDDWIVPNALATVELKDGNGVLIQRDTMSANAFGSAAGSIRLPENGFLGMYRLIIYCNNQYVTDKYIRVEEYKRPTFETVLDQPKGSYKVGTEVEVNGTATAFAGYAVQGAKVDYLITRSATFPFRYYGWWRRQRIDVRDKTIASGECTTDADGRFTIRFTAAGDERLDSSIPLYRYTIRAIVTDISGETHEADASLQVSQRSLHFQVEIPECIRTYRELPSIPVRTENLSGEPQRNEVRYELVKLAQPDRYRKEAPFHFHNAADANEQFGNRFPQYDFLDLDEPFRWAETSTVATGGLTTSENSVLSIPNLSSLKTGAYKLKFSTTDTFGETCEEEFCFYIAQKELDFPQYSPLKIETENDLITIGDTVTFTVGSYLENQSVFIRIFHNDKMLEEKWVKISKGVYRYSHLVRKGEEGMFVCEAVTQWENEDYRTVSTIKAIDIQRDIHFDFATFRDKTEPGGQETVKIRLKDGGGTPLPHAELLCALYDASLDAFSPNQFPSTLFTDKKASCDFLRKIFSQHTINGFLGSNKIHTYPMTFPQWDTEAIFRFDLNDWTREADYTPTDTYKMMENSRSASLQCARVRGARSDGEVALLSGMDLSSSMDEEDAIPIRFKASIETGNGTEQPAIPLRSNFNETAFFYPFLTVQDGVVEFEYTLPESLTKWKMLGAAHTKNRQYGTFEKFVVTQKPLMVSPNLPRFDYAGDQWEFAVKVVNLSGERLEGEVDIQFHDAKDGSVILADKREVRLDSGATELIQEFVLIPEGFVGVTYVVTVEASGGGNTYSDGETGDVPVLSRKQIVTEALPLFITKKGSRTFSLKNLPASSSSILSCKLQFTPDPRWNAILALPYLMEYPYNCNEQIFSKLYANTVASYIIAQNPNFQSLIQNAMETQPEALRSRLVQNADLKQILLAETPWVTDAMNEDNEIQNIACLFDRQNIAEQRKAMVQKLERNQNADGGWNWFSSRYNERSNRYITQHLLIGSGRLMSKGVCKAGDNFLKESTLNRAVNFIDRDVEKEYQEYKKMQKKDSTLPEPQLTADLLHYLYTRSFFLKRKPANTDAYQYYKGELMEQAATLTGIYQKTLAALTLWQTNGKGDRELAKQLMLSIKKRAIHSEEMGMYWKKEGHGWFWYEAPIERQALLIEAFQTILQDEESVKEMKIWLLQQKRTQHWSSTRSTADACYALLLDNEKGRTEPAKHITVQLCGETIDFTETLQLPVKKDIESCLQDGSNGTVTLTRDDDGLSYGGVFVRYYKDIDEIEGTGTEMPLSVERQLYKVSYGDRGELLTELGAGGALQVGDRVRVRMVLRADRDMEFVHLKDLRAAAFEPTETLSGYRWQDGLSYYQSFRDASVNFFFDWLRKGTYVFEYTLFVTQSGEYSSGYASIQCMYAPEFCAHSASSGRITVRNRK